MNILIPIRRVQFKTAERHLTLALDSCPFSAAADLPPLLKWQTVGAHTLEMKNGKLTNTSETTSEKENNCQ
jgi:hypothetical protein